MNSNNNKKKITFYSRFEADILAKKKTITIRNHRESHFQSGDIVDVSRYEDHQYFCTIEIKNITPTKLDQLTEQHAQQENMSLEQLVEIITKIYPNQTDFFVIEFTVIEQ
ncbi:hypothetical protein CYY_008117 [Polysphondylium violaceum]|uniref:ASCH domain-containing protein n=1 Tax=Polysphondylium violaceum TaxID=133409 RepID=A0A8J4PM64_9MYCE|nr:hypothetical protein CYY_008117 [Polysphondylium violaceum]